MREYWFEIELALDDEENPPLEPYVIDLCMDFMDGVEETWVFAGDNCEGWYHGEILDTFYRADMMIPYLHVRFTFEIDVEAVHFKLRFADFLY